MEGKTDDMRSHNRALHLSVLRCKTLKTRFYEKNIKKFVNIFKYEF